jgi:hypothetical protein
MRIAIDLDNTLIKFNISFGLTNLKDLVISFVTIQDGIYKIIQKIFL